MSIANIDNTQGDLKILALAVQALIETHPDKESFKEEFLRLMNSADGVSSYSRKNNEKGSAELTVDFLKSATK